MGLWWPSQAQTARSPHPGQLYRAPSFSCARRPGRCARGGVALPPLEAHEFWDGGRERFPTGLARPRALESQPSTIA